MEKILGMSYAVFLCTLGGMIGQTAFGWLRPKLGLIWSGLVAAMLAFLVMVLVAALTQLLFRYPPL